MITINDRQLCVVACMRDLFLFCNHLFLEFELILWLLALGFCESIDDSVSWSLEFVIMCDLEHGLDDPQRNRMNLLRCLNA